MQREISGYLRSRKRKDGRREGRCTVRYDQRGKRIIKNDLGKTQAEVKAKLSMEIAEYRKVCITRSGKHAVAEWLVLRNPVDGCVAPKVQRQEMKTP